MRLLTTLVAAALLLPTSAFAQGGSAALIKDCQDEKIDGTYTATEYRDALKSLPTDVDEYTSCRDVLRSAQLRSAATTRSAAGGPATGSAVVPPTAQSSAQPAGAPAAPSTLAPAAPAAGGGSAKSSGTAAAPAPSAPAPAAAPAIPAPTPAVGGADPAVTPIVPVAAASGAGADVPPVLALVLTGLAAVLIAAAAIARRQRRRL